MKYSEKIDLLTKGVKWSEIKELEKQEAEEAEAAALEAKEKEAEKAKEKEAEEKTALQAAQEMIKELESKVSAKEDELTKLNKQMAEINNKRTVTDEPVNKDSATDVMKQLFHPTKEKEEN